MSKRVRKRPGTGKPRGRPKSPWEIFADELFRRLKSGEAHNTVQAEARHLAQWAAANGIRVDHGAPIKLERIRERIKKRLGGTQGYINARDHHRRALARGQI
jgi:hypothetical protein